MVKSRLNVSMLALSAALLLTSPAISEGKEKAVLKLDPTTSWTATMIEGPTPADGYCALARKFDQGLVLTLGQSARDEYSLAIDFQGQKLNMDKAYKITLQPGPGEIRAYELMPASSQAMVVRLGYDQGFLQSLQKSNQLKVEIDGKSYQFMTNNMTKGRSELDQCMAGLKGEDATKTASNFSAEKIDNSEFVAEPVKVAEKAVVPSAPEKVESKKSVSKKIEAVKVESKKEVKAVKKALPIPTPERVASQTITTQTKEVTPVIDNAADAIIAPEPIIVPAKQATVEKAKSEVKAKKPIQIARVDSQSVTPKPSMPAVVAPKVEAIVTPEPIIVPAKPVEEVAVVERAKEIVPDKPIVVKDNVLKAEDKKISSNRRVSFDPDAQQKISARPTAMAAQDKKYGSVSNLTKKAAVVPKPKVEPVKVAAVKEEVKVKPAPKIKAEPKKPEITKTEPVKVKPEEIEIKLADSKVIDEKKFPKPFSRPIEKKLKEAEPKKDVVSPVVETPRAPVEAEKPKENAVDLAAEKELLKIKGENERLAAELKVKEEKFVSVKTDSVKSEKELAGIRDQLKELEKENHQLYQDAKKARGDIDTAVAKTSNQALKKMIDYEKKLEAANLDNLALSKEIEELRRTQEDMQLNTLSDDPAAQQSLRRYNEAEREIKRLGLLLEQQRLSHRQEKVELEDMLFDPAVTDQAQRRKLADLESRLAEAEKRFQIESQKVNKVDATSQAKLRVLEAKLAEAKKRERDLAAEEEKVKAEAKKVAAAEVKLATLAQKEQVLKMKEQKLLMESKKLSAAEATLAQARIKEQEIKAAEEKIRMEAQKVAQAEAKLAQAKRKEQQILAAEQALRAKTQKIALAEAKVATAQAKMAEVNKKQAQVAAAQKRLNEQSKKIAAYSRERISSKAPMAVVDASRHAPNALTPSARNVRSNPVAKAPMRVATPSFGKGNIQSILNQSGLSSVSNVVKQAAGRYSWSAAGMSGKAEVILNKGGQSVSQFAQKYIAKEKRNCRGDFASLPSSVPNGKQGYEIACVGPNAGKSASVVFAQKGRDLIAIIHETSADNMDAAMDARDKVASKL